MAIAPDGAAPGWGQQSRPVLGAALVSRAALGGAGAERLWALSDGEVEEAMTALGQVHASSEALLVAVLGEAKTRGLGTGDGWGARDWARLRAPGLSARLLADVDAIAGAAEELRLSEVRQAVAEGVDPDAVDALPVGKAAQVVRFHERTRGLAEPDQLEEVTHTLVESARGRDGMSEKALAVAITHTTNLLRPDRLVEHEAEVRRAHRSLFKSKGPMGMWRYTMLLDEEGAASLDSAIDPLAKPESDPDSGERDPRTADCRRADALLDLVKRAVGAPEGVPRQAKTSLVVTIGLAQLQQGCRGAGLTLGGELLSIETVRRLACDAQVIPAVLGAHGEVLEQGRAERLFNRAQVRHLWLRDKHCTFPGCTKPASWCDVHHLIHWADDGPTDIDHGALLCERHHTVVHAHRYAGEVVQGPRGPSVRWDLTPGSYDTHVAAWGAGRQTAALSDAPADGSTTGRVDDLDARAHADAEDPQLNSPDNGPPRP